MLTQKFSGQKVTFGVAFRVTLGSRPESHVFVTFELLLFFRVSGVLGGQLRFSLGNEGKDGKDLRSQTRRGSPRRPAPRHPRPPGSTG